MERTPFVSDSSSVTIRPLLENRTFEYLCIVMYVDTCQKNTRLCPDVNSDLF